MKPLTQAYYHQGLFIGLVEGEWPEEPDEVDGAGDFEPQWDRYESSLTSAIERAVPFEDQVFMDSIVLKELYGESWTLYLKTKRDDQFKEGLYTIPEIQVEIKCKVWCGGAGCIPNRDRCTIPSPLAKQVLRISESPKQETQEEREAKEDKLWFEFLYDVGSQRHLLNGETEPEQWELMRKCLEGKYNITITRKLNT